MNRSAKSFVSVIRQIVKEEVEKLDRVIPCKIIAYHAATDTVDIVTLTDENTIINGIQNFSKFQFLPGDTAYLYLIQNTLSNSFIIGRQGGSLGL